MKFRRFAWTAMSTLVLWLLGTEASWAEYGLNMRRGVTPLSREFYDLHMLIFWTCVAIAVVVFGVMFYAIIFHRKSRGHQASKFYDSKLVEVIWTIIPFAILVAMAIPSTRTLMAIEDTSDADITIKITGHQWYWEYEYLDEDIKFLSNLPSDQRGAVKPNGGQWFLLDVDNPVVVPIGKKVRWLITSKDVLHSWWMPDFGVKRDAVPGFIHEDWSVIEKTGTYRGQCAELCGVYHGYMPIVVKAVTDDQYKAWLEDQKNPAGNVFADMDPDKEYAVDELVKLGEQAYNTNCAACHQQNGGGMPPTFPALKGSPVATGPAAGHISTVLHGVKGTAMASFARLNDVELAAIITYERKAWGNSASVVQPKDVKAARDE